MEEPSGDASRMDSIALETKLQRAFKQSLDLPPEIPFASLEFAKSANWDSVAHLHLIAAIEEEFGIMMETKDVLDLSSYSKALEIVRKYDPSIS